MKHEKRWFYMTHKPVAKFNTPLKSSTFWKWLFFAPIGTICVGKRYVFHKKSKLNIKIHYIVLLD